MALEQLAQSARLLRLLVLACWLSVVEFSIAAGGHHLTSVASPGVSVHSGFLDTKLQGWSRASPSARQKDDYEYDYDEEEDDDEDDDGDYFYGTKKKKKKKPSSSTAVAAAASPSETNVFNFVRLMIMRLVWGFASVFGFEEPLSEAFNGAFVPPGVDDYGDDDGLGFDGDYRDYY